MILSQMKKDKKRSIYLNFYRRRMEMKVYVKIIIDTAIELNIDAARPLMFILSSVIVFDFFLC